jgi:Uri superfamily endonuclease
MLISLPILETRTELIPSIHQSYAVYFSITKVIEIYIRRFGSLMFQPGTYVYVGSAKKGIRSRVSRHLRKEKKVYWHIDYLLTRNEVSPLGFITSTATECQLNQSINGQIVVFGFGSTDCLANCGSHLKKLK